MTEKKITPPLYMGQSFVKEHRRSGYSRYEYPCGQCVDHWDSGEAYYWYRPDMSGYHRLDGPAVKDEIFFSDPTSGSGYWWYGVVKTREEFIRLYEITFLEEYKGT